jgi:hypothetical protein
MTKVNGTPGCVNPYRPAPAATTGELWVDRDDLQHVIAELHLPPEAHFGFNYEDDRAWVVAEASVDLRSLVDGILAS